MSTYLKDLLERGGFTLLQAAAALLITESAGWDVWWAAPLALALSLVKSFAAKFVGDKDSASLVPTLQVSEKKV